MDPQRVSNGLHQLVDLFRADPDKSVTPAEAAAITEVLLTSMHRYFSSIDSAIYSEFRVLSERIKTAREEIAELRPTELSQERIPRAGKELEAIVQSTEEASGTIMDAAETIMSGDPADDGYADMVQENCLRIFEACSFQDLTGQRISKVVDTLTFIEDRLTHMSAEWSGELQEAAAEPRDPDDHRSLLNGPALKGEGIDQSAIDALMDDAALAPTPAAPPQQAAAPVAKPATAQPAPKPTAPAKQQAAPAPKPAATAQPEPKPAAKPAAAQPEPKPAPQAKPAAAAAAKPAAKPAEVKPVAAQPAPKPEAKQAPKPEAKQPAPEAKKLAPETKQPAPEAKKPAPEAKKPAPEAKKPDPAPEAEDGETFSQDEIDALFA